MRCAIQHEGDVRGAISNRRGGRTQKVRRTRKSGRIIRIGRRGKLAGARRLLQDDSRTRTRNECPIDQYPLLPRILDRISSCPSLHLAYVALIPRHLAGTLFVSFTAAHSACVFPSLVTQFDSDKHFTSSSSRPLQLLLITANSRQLARRSEPTPSFGGGLRVSVSTANWRERERERNVRDKRTQNDGLRRDGK